MKRWLLVACLLLAGVAAIATVVLRNKTSASPAAANARVEDNATPASEPVLVGVDQLMRNVDRYRNGSIRVEGVVSATSSGERTLALIDCREFEQCGLGCAELTLPVQWSGPMPAVQETIWVEGEIQQAGGKLIFVARAVEKLKTQEPR